jgi:hypothetical protein
VKLLDVGWKIATQGGDLRRLIESSRHDDIARPYQLAILDLNIILTGFVVAPLTRVR